MSASARDHVPAAIGPAKTPDGAAVLGPAVPARGGYDHVGEAVPVEVSGAAHGVAHAVPRHVLGVLRCARRGAAAHERRDRFGVRRARVDEEHGAVVPRARVAPRCAEQRVLGAVAVGVPREGHGGAERVRGGRRDPPLAAGVHRALPGRDGAAHEPHRTGGLPAQVRPGRAHEQLVRAVAVEVHPGGHREPREVEVRGRGQAPGLPQPVRARGPRHHARHPPADPRHDEVGGAVTVEVSRGERAPAEVSGVATHGERRLRERGGQDRLGLRFVAGAGHQGEEREHAASGPPLPRPRP